MAINEISQVMNCICQYQFLVWKLKPENVEYVVVIFMVPFHKDLCKHDIAMYMYLLCLSIGSIILW